MSTPEQPATPALTRKQMRELRNTGSTPVITAAPTSPTTDDPAGDGATGTPATAPPSAVTPFPRPADPAPVGPPPVADSAVDLGVSPLTRRQARQQERIRTASVPVITPEVVAAHAAATSGSPAAFPSAPPAAAPDGSPEPEQPLFTAPADQEAPVTTDSGLHALFGLPRQSSPEDQTAAESAAVEAPTPAPAEVGDDASARSLFDDGEPAAEEADDRPKSVSPLLGASLLDEHGTTQPQAVEFPPSFDQLLARTTGAVAVPNTLIVSQAPEVSPLVAPVTATGEVILTGTFNLPEGLGSTGHVKGTADGKEIDAALVDGELPSHSSPTPIAASAAVSTVKMPGEVIKPPAPEKGGRLMMALAITAGVLALALVGVLILAFVTGVF
ncbi:hypothetical protein [Microbacterium timonense]|uniref:hypothetical protein n=1 Tax=Microbacterium timonense TaxID=2086576 RepID=UPI000D0EDC56|nr:hypothetical protein [Microbacterium timonense]